MSANFVRLTVIADDSQLDVSLPAQQPVVEYIDEVLTLLGPSRAPVATAWTLSAPACGPIDLEETLADHAIGDGAQLYLTEAPDAAPPPFVDDVLAELHREVDARYQPWTAENRKLWLGVTLGVIVTVCGAMVVTDGHRWAVAGSLAVLASVTLISGVLLRGNGLGHLVWAAAPVAGAAAWRAGESHGVPGSIVFTLAAASAAAAVGVWARRGTMSLVSALMTVGAILAVAGAAFVGGMSAVAASVWSLPILAVGMIMAPRIALASSGLRAQMRLSERMQPAERRVVEAGLARGRHVVDVIVWATSALVVAAVAAISAGGVWEQGLAAAFIVMIWLLRSRNFAHTRHVAPMVLAAGAAAALWLSGLARWLDLSGGLAVLVAGAAGAVVLASLFAIGAAGELDEVLAARIRRLLDGVDLPLAILLVPVVFFAQGVYELVWPS
ncbi:MAG: EsaB/YukD family protein [Gordonia amarae]